MGPYSILKSTADLDYLLLKIDIHPHVMDIISGNGNKDGLFSILLRDYNAHAAAACMNRLAKLR